MKINFECKKTTRKEKIQGIIGWGLFILIIILFKKFL